MNNQSIDNDIKELLKEVPPQIKAVFASGKVGTVAASLIQKYRLHVDQAGIVEREVSLLALALVSPTEFASTLSGEAKLDAQTIRAIMQDVNQQIFMPIREEMRRAHLETPEPAPKAPPQRVIPSSVPMPNYSAPPLQSPRYEGRDTKIGVTVVAAPLPPKVTMPRAAINQTPVPSAVRPISVAPAMQSQSIVPKFAALPVGEESSAPRPFEIHSTIQVPQPTPVVQAPPPPPVPTPPVAPSVPPVPPMIEIPVAPVNPTPTAPNAPAPVVAAHSTDPYREQIEEA